MPTQSDQLATLARQLNDGEVDFTQLPDGTSVILDVRGHQAVTVSRTGTVIVNLIAGGETSQAAIADQLEMRFKVDRETAERDVGAFVTKLIETLEHADDHQDSG